MAFLLEIDRIGFILFFSSFYKYGECKSSSSFGLWFHNLIGFSQHNADRPIINSITSWALLWGCICDVFVGRDSSATTGLCDPGKMRLEWLLAEEGSSQGHEGVLFTILLRGESLKVSWVGLSLEEEDWTDSLHSQNERHHHITVGKVLI